LKFIYNNFDLLFDNAGSVETFKKLILEMAVRGKLVPQDPNDEPACFLIERISKEKERLVQEGEFKKEKPLPPIKADELPFGLPSSWEWVRLGEVVIFNPRNKLEDDLEVSFIPMKLIDQGFTNKHGYEVKIWKDIKNGFTHFMENDVVLAKITPCFENRKSAIMANLKNAFGAGTTELHVMRTIENLMDPEYLLIVIKTQRFLDEGVRSYTGTAGQQRISKAFCMNYIMPLPPLKEQKRIVQNINEIFEMIPKFQKALDQRVNYKRQLNQVSLNTLTNASNREEFIKSVQFVVNNFDSLYDTAENIKELRQAILTLAVQGKLVPQDSNDMPVFESYCDLIHKINTLLKNNGKNIKYSQAIDYKKHHISVPENWRIAKLSHIADFIDYRGRTPQKTSLGVPLITAKNIKMGYMSQEPREYISEDTYNNWMTRGMPSKGDVLFTTEAPLGNVCQVDIDGKFALAQRAIAFKLINVVEPSFLKYILMSNTIQEDIYSKATGTTAKGIKASRLKEVIIPIPPLNEQKRIVQKIDKCMAHCDVLDNRIAECSSISDQLLATVMHEAFADVS
jgi:type I restriction enzyme S subunit